MWTPPCFIFIYFYLFFWGMWLSGMSLSLFPMSSYKYKSGTVAFDLPQRKSIIKMLVPHAAFIMKNIGWLQSL